MCLPLLKYNNAINETIRKVSLLVVGASAHACPCYMLFCCSHVSNLYKGGDEYHVSMTSSQKLEVTIMRM